MFFLVFFNSPSLTIQSLVVKEDAFAALCYLLLCLYAMHVFLAECNSILNFQMFGESRPMKNQDMCAYIKPLT